MWTHVWISLLEYHHEWFGSSFPIPGQSLIEHILSCYQLAEPVRQVHGQPKEIVFFFVSFRFLSQHTEFYSMCTLHSLTIILEVYAELTEMPWTITLPTWDGISENFGVTLHNFSQMYDWTTVIRFVVNVPVLSEQIDVALPIVSQASKWRTRLLSFIIFWWSRK